MLTPSLSRDAPPNCHFECDDVNQGLDHYKNHFDVIHLRCVSAGIKDGQAFFYEVYDLLRPGGLLLVVDGNGMHREGCTKENQAEATLKEAEMGFEDRCCQQDEETAEVS